MPVAMSPIAARRENMSDISPLFVVLELIWTHVVTSKARSANSAPRARAMRERTGISHAGQGQCDRSYRDQRQRCRALGWVVRKNPRHGDQGIRPRRRQEPAHLARIRQPEN